MSLSTFSDFMTHRSQNWKLVSFLKVYFSAIIRQKKKELNEGKKRNNKEYRMMIMMTIMIITNRNNHFPRVFEHQATVHSLDIWLFSSIVALTLNNTCCAS